MGIFRPNKLGYTSEDVDKKSNSYIMTVVEKFTYNINKIVEAFKSEVKGVIEQQDSDISDISDNVAALSEALGSEATEREKTDAVLRENINSINLNLDDERNIRQTADENLQREISDEINNRSNLFSEFDTKYENITGEIKRNLNMEIAQREGTNAMHDSQITELYSKKADKTEVEGLRNDKADKSTTLAGYGILDGISFVEGYEDKIDYYQGKVIKGQWLPVLYKIIGSKAPNEPSGDSGTITITSGKFNEYYLYAVTYNNPINVDGVDIDVTQIKLGYDGLYIRKGRINGSINTRNWGAWKSLESKDVDLSGYYTKDEVYAKDEIDGKMGSVETALDGIIAIQNSLIGGGTA